MMMDNKKWEKKFRIKKRKIFFENKRRKIFKRKKKKKNSLFLAKERVV